MLQQRSPDDGNDRALFTAASGQSLPFAAGSYDAILCTAAFHHLPDPASAMAEFRRDPRDGQARISRLEACQIVAGGKRSAATGSRRCRSTTTL